MGENIYDTKDDFDFNKINISKPISLSNGNFILKYSIGDFPLYINPPKCTIKSVSKGSKRTHCDFIFSQENDQFIRWIENLEKLSQDKIYANRSQWFETELEKEDIENYFTSPLKIYKSGKFYILRTNLPTAQQKQNFKIYDENENEIQFDSINEDMQIMCVLEIQGIKCSSSSFQIEILVKQMMVLRTVNLFEKCIIKNKPENITIKKDFTSLNNSTDIELETQKTLEEKPESLESLKSSESLEREHKTLEEIETPILDLPTEIIDSSLVESKDENELCEVDFDIDDMDKNDAITIKQRKDMYYEMYEEARRKAKIARDLALSAYLEARRIKNTYMLEDILDSSDESDIDELEEME
uniref:Uncharacterized protein n=1 Tax=viral metagenome TaxID=1070528 RepID=A0A6C0HYJ1_9ZZZZ